MTDLDLTSQASVLRIIDACGNRAMEGLRTAEEYARFRLQDRFLTEAFKQSRHDLRTVLDSVPLTERCAARSVSSDCGTAINTPSEQRRSSPEEVLQAALGRVMQSLRCIEEYGKTLPTFNSQAVEALRYRLYTLASAVTLMLDRAARLRDARLYLLMPCDSDFDRFELRVQAFFEAGVDIIQLRDKTADDRLLYRCAQIGAEVARRLGKWFIINDRADIAAASQASGVHVGQEELPIEAVRRVVGPTAIIGMSTHDIGQARAAVLDGADYIGCGPTFPSKTKQFSDFPGLKFLAEVAAEITLPAFAIGGIGMESLNKVMHTGIHGIAVSGAILGQGNGIDPAAECQAAKTIRQRLSQPAS